MTLNENADSAERIVQRLDLFADLRVSGVRLQDISEAEHVQTRSEAQTFGRGRDNVRTLRQTVPGREVSRSADVSHVCVQGMQ